MFTEWDYKIASCCFVCSAYVTNECIGATQYELNRIDSVCFEHFEEVDEE